MTDTDLERVYAALLDRRPESHVEPSRDGIEALLDLLGNPQKAYPGVHLTGTNGKTSTARMVDELLRSFGLRTGRFTSPHLESVTERITLDGEPLSAARFVAAYDEVAPYVDLVEANTQLRIGFFELLAAMAFATFADAPVDVAVVEVGLGGSWDATNVLQAPVAVLTPISLDHTELLGDTVTAIATEKAGIVHAGAVAVSAAQPLAAAEELARRALAVSATLAREGAEFGVLERRVALGGQLLTIQGLGGVYDEVFLPLHGRHQASNAACALAAVEAFFGGGAQQGRLDIDAVRAGFAAVRSPGRLETVRTGPSVLLDGAHNPAGASALAAAMAEAFEFDRLVGVVGILAGKDARAMLEALESVLTEIVVTAPATPRALPADELARLAVDIFGADRVEVAPQLDDALVAGIRLAEEGDARTTGGVLVTGSLVTVGQARILLRGPAGGAR